MGERRVLNARDLFILLVIAKLTVEFERPPLQRELVNAPRMEWSYINVMYLHEQVPKILFSPITSVGQFTQSVKRLKDAGVLDPIRGYYMNGRGTRLANELYKMRPVSNWPATVEITAEGKIADPVMLPKFE